MKYIFGLGNPGPQYELTRHNAGFLFLDYLIEECDHFLLSENSYYKLFSVSIEEVDFRLVYPLTYMNLSGKVVHHFVETESINTSDFLIAYDDFHLPFGKIRFREKGTDAGHNGIKNISLMLQTEEYNRLRIGIGAPDTNIIDYVLGDFPDQHLNQIPNIFNVCKKAIIEWNNVSFKSTMDIYNGLNIL